MEDEGKADWTLQRQVLRYNQRKQERIQNRDVSFLMRVRSKLPYEFDEEDEQIRYAKAKLKDVAFNGR